MLEICFLIFKNGPNPASFLFIFALFYIANTNIAQILTKNDKTIDGVLGSQTRGSRMESADEST